jgi:hypothetical protein
MSTTDQFLIALQAYQEVQAELNQPGENIPITAPDPAQVEDLPEGALLLGLDEDGLPLTLDLYDPAPGALLVAGERGCGKTRFLQSLAAASDGLQDVQFAVITPTPEEWEAQEALPNCLGIWPDYHPSSGQFLEQLTSWAEVLPGLRQTILLFVDGLDVMMFDSAARRAFRWLLAEGPQHHVWPVVAVHSRSVRRLGFLLESFQTRILGRLRHSETARLLLGDREADLAALVPGAQFCLTWPQGCLRFWLPPAEGVSYARGNALV